MTSFLCLCFFNKKACERNCYSPLEYFGNLSIAICSLWELHIVPLSKRDNKSFHELKNPNSLMCTFKIDFAPAGIFSLSYVRTCLSFYICSRGSAFEFNLNCHAHRGTCLSNGAIRGNAALEKSWKKGSYRQAVQKAAMLGAERGPKWHIHLNSFAERLGMSRRP